MEFPNRVLQGGEKLKYKYFLLLILSYSVSNIFINRAFADENEGSHTKRYTFKWYACEVQRELPAQIAISDGGYPLFKAFHDQEKNLVGYGLENMVNKTAVEFLRFDKISMRKNILMPLQVYFMGRENDYSRKYQSKKEVLVKYRGVFWGGDRSNICDWVLDFFIFASKKSVVSKIHIDDAIKWLVDKLEAQNKLYYFSNEIPEMVVRGD